MSYPVFHREGLVTDADRAEAKAELNRPCSSCGGSGRVGTYTRSVCGKCRGAGHDAIIREGIHWVMRRSYR